MNKMPQDQDLIFPDISWNGVQFFTTTRAGGVGLPPYDTFNLGMGAGDDPAFVSANRQRLRARIPSDPIWLKQVHGHSVVDGDVPPTDLNALLDAPPSADASVTTVPGRVLAILTADCLPVVMADGQGTVLGVAHAGWRGLASGVLENTLDQMRQRKPNASGWRAWIGPGIGKTVFQVGDEVRVAFEGHGADQPGLFVPDPTTPGKWLADLPGLACWRLRQYGIQDIELSGLCTVTDPLGRFYSYRRDKVTGRMATIAWLSGERHVGDIKSV